MTTSTRAGVLALAAAAVLAAWAGAGRAEVAVGEPMDFPHAGLAVAMPADYQSQTVSQPFDIARAILSQNNQPVQAVTVAALPLNDPNITTEELADEMVAAQEQNLAIRNLQVLSKAPMKVADQPGAARFIAYSFRGEQTVAASVVFCRTLPSPQGRLEYVITVEAAADRKAEVLPVLGEVVKSVRLMTVVRPIDIPLKPSGRVVEPPGGAYALHVPHGWFAQADEIGVKMAQADYTLGGEPTLSACVLAADAPEAGTAEQHAQQCIDAAVRNAAEQGMETQVVSNGPARLGSAEAHQLAFEERVPRAASAPAPEAASGPTSAAVEPPTGPPATQASEAATAEPNNVVIVQRSALLPAAQAGGPPRRLTLVLVCLDAKPPTCIAAMDKLAEGMVFRAPSAGPATSRPAGGEPGQSASGEPSRTTAAETAPTPAPSAAGGRSE